jgi:(1->4)-alpha-D-glucan 1-alpha-D-glucosylmutase
MAKGVEDTTFYLFDRLLPCNEVGASASMLGISSDKFHELSLLMRALAQQFARDLDA